MKITEQNIRTWSALGQRGTLGLSIIDIAKDNEKLMVLSADLGNTSGLSRFKELYPNKFINTGIAEQNMIGVAAGLAKEDYNVFCTTFATFASMRAYEMVKLNMGYMKFNIKLFGLTAGFGMGMFGNTHYATEDIALMRLIPNLCIISPADCTELVKTVEALKDYIGPAYIRLTGISKNPIVYNNDYKFEIGKSIQLKEGKEITIIATGSMVYNALNASDIIFNKTGINCRVINMHTIAPLDINQIKNVCDSKLIVSVEEHSIVGGLGGAIAEVLSEMKNKPPLLKLGAMPYFNKAGSYNHMLEVNALLSEQIAQNICDHLI